MATNRTTNAPNTNAAPPQFAPIAPDLLVPDVTEASAFYQKLGFEEVMTIPSPDGEPGFVMLNYGTSNLMLERIDDPDAPTTLRRRQAKKATRGLGVALYLNVPDVKKVYNLAKKAGLEITSDLEDKFYGDRVFACLDPYGYEWQIAQTVKQLSPDEMIRAAKLIKPMA